MLIYADLRGSFSAGLASGRASGIVSFNAYT